MNVSFEEFFKELPQGNPRNYCGGILGVTPRMSCGKSLEKLLKRFPESHPEKTEKLLEVFLIKDFGGILAKAPKGIMEN